MDSIRQEILKANHLEHFKVAKEYSLIFAIDNPKRVKLELAINELQEKINEQR